MVANATTDAVLTELGARGDRLDRLRAYVVNPFRLESLDHASEWPHADEPHVQDWRSYSSESRESGVFACLASKLSQLNVPIREGVSGSDAYGKLSRRGESFREDDFGGRLELLRADTLELFIHDHPAGALPVLATDERQDFVSLFRALACKSEPRDVSPSVNAQMIAGLNNWDRIARYKEAWERRHPFTREDDWFAEMQRVAKTSPGRFRDRVILVFKSAYSGVSAAEVGLGHSDEEWVECSMRLRVEHEFTHYATKRLFGCMGLSFHDELIADCMGMTHALGSFSKDRFAAFMGLSRWPEVMPEARAHTYRGDLDDEAFTLAGRLALQAAAGLERICARFYEPDERLLFLRSICQLGLTQLACDDAEALFEKSRVHARDIMAVKERSE